MIKQALAGTSLILILTGCNKGSQSNDSVSTGAPAEVKLAEDRNLYSSGSGVEAAGRSSSSFGDEPKGSMEPTQSKTNVNYRPVFPDTPGVTPSGTGGLIPPAIAGFYESKTSIEDGGPNPAQTPNRSAAQQTQPGANVDNAPQQQGAAEPNQQPQGNAQGAETEQAAPEQTSPSPQGGQSTNALTPQNRPIEEPQQGTGGEGVTDSQSEGTQQSPNAVEDNSSAQENSPSDQNPE
ncbi:MAG: hypothetical protein ACO1QB_05275 [Verrucomicrobiales bacterium]